MYLSGDEVKPKPAMFLQRVSRYRMRAGASPDLRSQVSVSFQANDRIGFVHTSEMSMEFVLQPWQWMLIILASWVNRQQQEVVEYHRTQNAVLKERFGKKRILLTDELLGAGSGDSRPRVWTKVIVNSLKQLPGSEEESMS